MANKKLYTIGDISEICGVPIKTLRYYDEINLLVPEKRDSETNYRYYTEKQMLVLHNIRKFKSYGFSLDEIHTLLSEPENSSLKDGLITKLNDIHDKIESMQALYNEILSQLDKIEAQSGLCEKKYSVSIEEIPQKGWIYTRRVEKNFKNDFIPVCRWFEIFELIRKNRFKSDGVIRAVYHNAPIEQFLKTECDLEIGMPIKENTDFPFFKSEKPYTTAVSMHYGGYENMVSTYIKTIKWVNSNGYEIDGPIAEEYMVSPIDLKNDDQFVTRIIIPVKNK